MAGGLFSLAKLFGITLRESATDGSDFTNPDADYRRLFLGEDGNLHLKDSAGAVTDVGGGGGGSTFSGCRVHRATNQAIADSTDTAISWSSDSGTYDYDEGGIWAIGNPTRLVANATGYWDVEAGITWDGDTTGPTRLAYIVVNGTTFYFPQEDIVPTFGFLNQRFHEQAVPLTSGDYIEVYVFQGTGGPVNVLGGDSLWAKLSFRGAP